MVFVDSAASNEATIREWAKAFQQTEERPNKAMLPTLTRTGTEFTPPKALERHLPEFFPRATKPEG